MEITNRKIEPTPVSEDAFTLDADLLHDGTAALQNNEREVERLRQELEAEQSARLRLAAEYQNYRRRTELERTSAAEKGKHELLLQLLSVADDLDLAISGLDESSGAVSEGIRMIHRRFIDTLAANGVTPFDSEDELFDPERHEAFDVVPAGERRAATVERDLRRGYFWNDKLLRPALVVVRQ